MKPTAMVALAKLLLMPLEETVLPTVIKYQQKKKKKQREREREKKIKKANTKKVRIRGERETERGRRDTIVMMALAKLLLMPLKEMVLPIVIKYQKKIIIIK